MLQVAAVSACGYAALRELCKVNEARSSLMKWERAMRMPD